MDRIMVKARSFHEADLADLAQHRAMTPAQRQLAALELKRRVFGDNCPDVRASGAFARVLRSQ
jgi:hypothetical protein